MASTLIGPNTSWTRTGKKRKGKWQPEVIRSKLNLRQLEFCEHYLSNGMNGTAAAKAAGYSPKRAHLEQTRLLKKKPIRDYLSWRKSQLQEEIDVTREELLDKMRRVLSFNLMKHARGTGDTFIVDEDHYDAVADAIGDCVTKVKAREVKDRKGGTTRTIEIELMSKDKMFELAMRYKNMLEDRGGQTANNINLMIGGGNGKPPVNFFDALLSPPDGHDVVEQMIHDRTTGDALDKKDSIGLPSDGRED
jgi:hypothetical protein